MVISFASCGKKSSENGFSNEITTKKETVKITIPEGYTLVRISWLLRDKGLCTSEEFIEKAQTFNEWLDLTKYPFLNGIYENENLCFKLEGYLFPLTYEIPKDATVEQIIETFLRGTSQKFSPQLLEKVESTGYSLHEILTIASIIEKEAALNEQRPKISSVIHNRINANMKIECDPTVAYCEKVIKPIYPEKFDEFAELYSAYKKVGLIAGPICNPSIESIEAAISPADTPYFYFVVGTVPPYEDYYSKTFEEHTKFWRENKDRLTGKTAE